MRKKINDIDNDLNKEIIFPNAASRISYYYEKLFNVKIVGLFYKNNLNQELKKYISECNYLEVNKFGNFLFFVLIKDYNKKIIKYRLLKCHYNSEEIPEKIKNMSFLDIIYFFVDKELGEYCRKKYIKNYNDNEISKLIIENQKINNVYNDWINNQKDN